MLKAKVLNIQRLSFPNILLYFIIYAEFTYVYFICTMQILYDSGLLHFFSQFLIQCPHIGALKPRIVGGFTNGTNQKSIKLVDF